MPRKNRKRKISKHTFKAPAKTKKIVTGINTLKRKAFENVVENVIDTISPYLNTKALIALSACNLKLNSLFQDEQVWRQRYLVDMGKLYYPGDYKAQYIAESLSQCMKNQQNNKNEFYKIVIKLNNHLEAYKDKPWTHYYHTIIFSTKEWEGFIFQEETIKSALLTLQCGDFRVAYFLLDYLLEKIKNQTPIPKDIFNKIVDFLPNEVDEFKKLAYLFKALKVKQADLDYYIVPERDQLLQEFINFFDPNDVNVERFHYFFIQMITIFSLFTIKETSFNKKTFLKKATVFDALAYFLSLTINWSEKRWLYLWMKRLADGGHVKAAFVYAESLRLEIRGKLISGANQLEDAYISTLEKEAIIYYLKAYEGGDYRAVCSSLKNYEESGGIFLLASTKNFSGKISKKEFDNMVFQGALNRNIQCLQRLSSTYLLKNKWQTDPRQVWILQEVAITLEYDDIMNVYATVRYKELVEAAIQNPDFPFLNLALSVISVHHTKSDQAFLYYSRALHARPEVVDEYLATGKQCGLLQPAHESILHSLSQHYQERQVAALNTSLSFRRLV